MKAADKAMLMATGVGNIQVDIPNGDSMTAVTLKGVLYCPDLMFTLVSLTRCDATKYNVQLKDYACVINDKAGCQIG